MNQKLPNVAALEGEFYGYGHDDHHHGTGTVLANLLSRHYGPSVVYRRHSFGVEFWTAGRKDNQPEPILDDTKHGNRADRSHRLSDKGDFDQSNDCGVLGAGASCTVKVTFAPEKKGTQNGNLRIITPQEVVQVSLKGTGR
jgi:hypothetical protein